MRILKNIQEFSVYQTLFENKQINQQRSANDSALTYSIKELVSVGYNTHLRFLAKATMKANSIGKPD